MLATPLHRSTKLGMQCQVSRLSWTFCDMSRSFSSSMFWWAPMASKSSVAKLFKQLFEVLVEEDDDADAVEGDRLVALDFLDLRDDSEEDEDDDDEDGRFSRG